MWLLLGILAVPVIEIALFVQIGGHFGVIGTLAWVFLSAAAGLVLMRLEPQRNAQDLRAALDRDTSPASPMAHSALRMIGAVLIFVPGFFTDALGVLLLVPPIRRLLLIRLLVSLKSRHSRHESIIIEGEYDHTPPQPGPDHARIERPENRD
ncbi:MAG: FxsA family protein [Natronohydrobacter sp.]|nr:FxsA family protein [Natronohydrobacter sp.]